MPNIVPIRAGALTRNDARRLALFTKTVGKDLQGTEIDEALDWCHVYGANPFVKDIYFFVFDAKDAAKRRVVPVLSIQLYRKNADATQRYRPDDRPARFTYDEALKGPDNPAGLVSCEVTVYKYVQGEWHPVTESVRWAERAPIREGGSEGFTWEDTGETWEDSGRPKKRKVPKGDVIQMLDPGKPNWRDMPETMLAKCCEAAAIRKAFPESVAGSYSEGELDAAHTIELTASEIVDRVESEQRMAKIGGAHAVMVDWMDGEPLQRVPVGQFADQVLGFLKTHKDDASHVMQWRSRNAAGLREFWALDKDGALAIKAELERVEAAAKTP